MRTIGNGLRTIKILTLLIGCAFQNVYRPLPSQVPIEQACVQGGDLHVIITILGV